MSSTDQVLQAVYPLSPMQHAMLYHYLSGQSDADLVQVECILREELDVDRFRTAWNRLAARHQTFRTRFRWDGVATPVQEVLRDVDFQPQVLDWRERAPDDRVRAFRDLTDEDRARGLNLGVSPPMRLILVHWTDAEWRCLWSWPHILMDGRSLPSVLREVFDLYDDARTADELPPAPQYSAFLEWLPTRSRDGEERYWRALLDGVMAATPLPGEEASAPHRGSGRGEQTARLTREETGAITALAQAAGVTLNTVLQGAWAVLLSRHSGSDDVVFGATRAGRQGTVPDAERITGLFINTLPVRAKYDPDARVGEWLRELRQQHLGVRSWEQTSLTDIQHWSGLGVGRPVFESLLVVNRTTFDEAIHAERPGWTHRTIHVREPAPFPVTLYTYGEGPMELRLVYERERLSDDAAARVLGHLVTLLAEIAKDPSRTLDDLAMLSDSERRRQLVEWNDTEHPARLDRCAHELVEEQVRLSPHRTAVTDGITTLTYRELDERANRLANRLRSMGVEPDRRVGVCIDRSVDLVVAVLGVLKAGGAYVPLDPDYPAERLEYMTGDAGLAALVTADGAAAGMSVAAANTQRARNGAKPDRPVVDLARDAGVLAKESAEPPRADVRAENLAYVIYTSGSTGRPKGVMVEHRNVVNFFAAMDARIPHDEPGTWLAVTSLSFDISVLELLWPLTRGFEVVVGQPVIPRERSDRGIGVGAERSLVAGAPRDGARGPEFSLFYFASGEHGQQDKYRLLIEGARFADQRGFHAVWTPERHFHAFGGLYPNPSVAAAALAGITSRVRLRAGSVVLPLHHPIRIAEEWSLVDNLSGGRVGISFASGWQPNDFVLAPDNYADRKRIMLEGIELVRRLWRGESVELAGPGGKPVEIRTLPRPIQSELPVWITTAGSADTYRAAGTAGAHVLTHLLGQSVDDLAAMIAVYREAWSAAGHPGTGTLTLMLHTFVGSDESSVRETVRGPMKSYLRSSVSLIKGFAGAWSTKHRSPGEARVAGDEFDTLSPEDLDSLLDFAFERYFETSGLFGTPARCLELIERLRDVGVDELACLIDFGVPTEEVLAHLEDLDGLRQLASRPARAAAAPDLSTLMRERRVTHLQCTPSLARMLLAEPGTRAALADLRVMLVGGEPLPAALAAELRERVGGPVINMYGPTETTVWSSTHEVRGDEHGTVPIGRPIANTRLYLLDRHGQPVPVGVPGELYIGGAGVVRGYLDRPELTSERFVPDPFGERGERLYRTGDVVRWRADGVVEFLGRVDHQVKIRGHRIELGEIEAVLAAHPDVGTVVVNPVHRGEGDATLVAYVVPANGKQPSDEALRAHAEARLPSAMVPSHVMTLASLPLTPNGKVDRKALPLPTSRVAPEMAVKTPVEEDRPPTALEELVAEVWRKVLGVERIGPRDHFFRLGGNSLTTIQVAMGVRESLGIDLPLRAIFEAPTVAELASDVERRLLASADAEALGDLLDQLEVPVAGEQRVTLT